MTLRQLDVPLPLRPRVADPQGHGVLCCVYRRRNAGHVVALARGAAARGWTVKLHALDSTAPGLTEWTESEGPGKKFDLIDQLMSTVSTADWWILADDDVEIVRGDLGRLVSIARLIGADVAQPAHHPRSHWNYHITLVRPGSRARTVTFVEIGPVVYLSGAAAGHLAPFHAGMGFGLEHRWSQAGLRLAVVDEVLMRHLSPTGADYDADVLWQEAVALTGVTREESRQIIRSTLSRHGLLRSPLHRPDPGEP